MRLFLALLLFSVSVNAIPPAGDYVVVLNDQESPRMVARDHGIGPKKEWTNALHGFHATLNTNQLAKLERDTRVQIIETNVVVHTCAQVLPTGVRRIGCTNNALWLASSTIPINCDVAVIDTGIDYTHPDLNVYQHVNFTTDSDQDGVGHGTHCAGIVGARNNGFGVVGVAPGCRLWSVKALDNTGNGYMSTIISAVDYVTQHASEIEVASLSFGGQGSSASLRTAISNSVARGVVYVVAAGNSGFDIYGGDNLFGTADDFYPACYPEVMAISALADSDGIAGGLGASTQYGLDDTQATFSNFSIAVVADNPVNSPGAAIDVAAPGVDIYSTCTNGTYKTMSGTSMACPHVAGAVALYIAQYGRATSAAGVAAIRQAIINSAEPQSAWGKNPTNPYPLLDKNPEGLVNVESFGGSVPPSTDAPPYVGISRPGAGQNFSTLETITFAGNAYDVEDGNLSASIVWRSSLSGVIGTGATITSAMRGGTHVITASVTDSAGTTTSTSITIVVIAPPSAPVLTILSPVDGGSVTSPVTLQGSAIDAQDGDISALIIWTSSINGAVGSGASRTTALTAGIHTITASVTDSSGVTVTASIRITVGSVNTAPVVVIASPANGSTNTGNYLTMTGTATDAQEGNISANIVWSSSINGTLAQGASVTVPLPFGTHVITARATDSGGLSGTATITTTMKSPDTPPPTNSPPIVSITQPGEGASFPQGTTVVFVGSANDTEEGDLSASIAWTDSVAGALGTGASVSTSVLTVGAHTVTASVADGIGATDAEQRHISITSTNVPNVPPTVTITAPASGVTITLGDALTFQGTGTDPEDGAITPTWNSSLDGPMITSTSFSYRLATVGTHTITARAVDTEGATGQASVTVVVNAAVPPPPSNTAPVVTITQPSVNVTIPYGQSQVLVCTAMDAQQGVMTNAVTWNDSLAGWLGNGGTVTMTTPIVGTHVVTAKVTDAGGLTGSASRTVIVQAPVYPLVVAVTASPTTVVNKQKVLLSTTVTANALPVSGITVNFSVKGASGKVSMRTLTTGAAGTASYYFQVNKGQLGVGVTTVTVNASKTGYTSGVGSTTFTVR